MRPNLIRIRVNSRWSRHRWNPYSSPMATQWWRVRTVTLPYQSNRQLRREALSSLEIDSNLHHFYPASFNWWNFGIFYSYILTLSVLILPLCHKLVKLYICRVLKSGLFLSQYQVRKHLADVDSSHMADKKWENRISFAAYNLKLGHYSHW